MSKIEGLATSNKNSDDIVSLDSWNEAISPLENVSNEGENQNVFFDGITSTIQTNRQIPARRSSSRDDGNMVLKTDAEHRLKSDALVLNPSNLEERIKRKPKPKKSLHVRDRSAQVMHSRDQNRFVEHEQTQKSVSQEFRNDSLSQRQGLPVNETNNINVYHRIKNSVHHQYSPHIQYQNGPSLSPRSHQQHHSNSQHSNQCKCNEHDNYRRDMLFNRGIHSGEQIGSSTFPPSRVHRSDNEQPSHSMAFDHDQDQSEKMKNKIMSVWNNMRYGWTLKTKTNFKCDSPIFLLGCCYHVRPNDDRALPGDKTQRLPSIERFKQDFSSQMWFTYRQDFPQIPGTKLTTDCGWGCMLRSGQMMLARALVNHFLGRNWSVFREQSTTEETYRKQIIRWFGDFPSDQTPFSVHRLAEIGKSLGKGPGEWYGPSSVAFIFRECMQKAYDVQPVLSDICIYVAQDCTIYKRDIYEMCSERSRSVTKLSESTDPEAEKSDHVKPTTSQATNSEEANEWKRAVIVLVPVRLGGEDLNPVYSPCIKSLLTQDSCIGIIGGKPKHSLYFIGFQDDKLIYLDPHYCQDAVDTRERNFPVQSYHCLSPRKMSVAKMDPSCTIGFYCKTKREFEKFVSQSEAMVSPPKQKMSYPMFVFSEGKGTDISMDSLCLEEDRLLRIRHVRTDQYGRLRSGTVESEEFVVL